MSFQELLSRTAMLAAPADTTDLAPLRAAVFAGLRAAGWTPVDIERGRESFVGQTDDALLAALVRGEAAAFDPLYNRHAPKLNGYARRWLSGADAADAVQESFLVLFEKAETVLAHQPVNVPGFLFGVLCNKMRRVLARRVRETVMEDPAADEPAPHDDGLVVLLQREEGEHLAELVERTCSPLEQEVMAMTIDGHEGPEIAGTLELKPGHVRVLRYRAAAKLRQALAEEGAT